MVMVEISHCEETEKILYLIYYKAELLMLDK